MASALSAEMSKRANTINTLKSFDAEEMDAWSAQELLTWAVKNFHPRLALSASFGAPEGMVLLDMMHRIDPAAA